MKRILLAAIWLACVAALALIFGGDWRKFSRLVEHGVSTKGAVVKKEPANHQFVTYSFVVGNRLFSGIDNAGRGGPTFDQLAVGDSVNVVYDSGRPDLSSLGDARSRLRSATVFMILLLATGPAILTYGAWLALQGRQRGGTPIDK